MTLVTGATSPSRSRRYDHPNGRSVPQHPHPSRIGNSLGADRNVPIGPLRSASIPPPALPLAPASLPKWHGIGAVDRVQLMRESDSGETMKVKILATAAFAILAALRTASAADIPMSAPAYKAPPPAPAYSWTGCYVGGGGGYGMWNQKSFVTEAGLAVTSSQTNGGEGGFGQGQAGCDYQFTLPIFNVGAVIGVFGDYEAGSLTGTSTIAGLVGNERESSAWAVGGRVGVLVTPRLLSYFDGGFSQARFDAVNYDIGIPGGGASGIAIPAQAYEGWFIGSGLEYAFDWLPFPGLFLKTEYRYSRYANPNSGVPFAGFPFAVALNSQKTTQMISTELVWRFNWFGGHY
jgi:outer membrane immunogenic protein